MDCQEFVEESCRICLQDNVEQDWTDYIDEHMTYKDCYYKYTQLDCSADDDLYLSTMLCRNCANNLENFTAFISKAIENYNLLKERLDLSEKYESDNDVDTKFETIIFPETEPMPDIQNIPINEDADESEILDIADNNEQIEMENNQDNTETSSNELQNEKEKSENSLICSICSKICANRTKVLRHEKTHFKSRERTETCKECGLRLYSKTSLNIHMQTHDVNRERTKKCEFCEKAFYSVGSLNVHRRIHLGKMVKCDLCPKEFFRQVDLDRHMYTHSAARISGDFKRVKKYFVCCDICGVSVRSVQYTGHYAKHMNEPLAKCGVCDKEFFSNNSCVTHLRKVHNMGREERSNFLISYRTNRCTNLFLQQNVSKLYTKD